MVLFKDTYTGRVDIVWKRVEGLRQAQDLLVTHIEGMKRNSQEQGEFLTIRYNIIISLRFDFSISSYQHRLEILWPIMIIAFLY
jgi:hypothetical protein